jgi:predicted O-methyltransferase YrrM
MRLHDIGIKHNTDKAFFHRYLDFYEKHLPKRNFTGRLLEIGVMDGASMHMWREYYPKAEIVGVDINDKSHLSIDGVVILRLDATDPEQMKDLGVFDIIVDDGSHMTADQQKSFEHLYLNQLSPNGYYVIEDLHTSLMDGYVNSDKTTLEWLKHTMLKHEFYHRDTSINDSMTCVIRAGQL